MFFSTLDLDRKIAFHLLFERAETIVFARIVLNYGNDLAASQ